MADLDIMGNRIDCYIWVLTFMGIAFFQSATEVVNSETKYQVDQIGFNEEPIKKLKKLRVSSFIILLEVITFMSSLAYLFNDIDTIELYLMLSGGIFTFLDSVNIIVKVGQILKNQSFYTDFNS